MKIENHNISEEWLSDGSGQLLIYNHFGRHVLAVVGILGYDKNENPIFEAIDEEDLLRQIDTINKETIIPLWAREGRRRVK